MKKLFALLILIIPLQSYAWACASMSPNNSIIIGWFILLLLLLLFINYGLLKYNYIKSHKEESKKSDIKKIFKYNYILIIIISLISLILMWIEKTFIISIITWTFLSFSLLNKKIYKTFKITSGYWNIFSINLVLSIILITDIIL
jgi:hypothetical protein